ncbi:MAG: tryptophan-rich sensory protein [Candidatus Aenigmarchaeota archaeon]|nr:tryptophan-rich sensory protein [Candidatus Aenigmarchaeota archaeon]
MKVESWSKLLFSVIVCNVAGVIGSIFTTPNITTWYATLVKPSFVPPNWVFAPVWTTLFIMMGVSFYFVWEKEKFSRECNRCLKVFTAQLVLNILWSVLFFGAKNLAAAFVEIIILWIFIAYTIRLFWNVDRRSGYLLMPYIAWVSFAALLNLSLWLLN